MDSHGTQLPAVHIQSGRQLNHPGDEHQRKTGFIPHCYWITDVPHARDLPTHCLRHWSTQPLQRQTHVQSLEGSEARAPVHSSHKEHGTLLQWHGAWTSTDTPMRDGHKTPITPVLPPVLSSLATVEQSPGPASSKAW